MPDPLAGRHNGGACGRGPGAAPGLPTPRRYTRPPVKSSVEPLEGNKVKVYVEIDEAEFDRDIERAFKTIAREVNLPGFRAGKAPRRVLEARIGIGPAREQALRESIPQYLAKAVREHDVDLIATPEIEITGGQDDGPVEFDATCEVRPEVTVPGYNGLRVELPSPAPSDEEIDEVVQGELRRHGVLEDVDRPAEHGDYVVVDLEATREGEPVPGLNTEDWSYEIGQGWVADTFDDELIGAAAGDTLSFTVVPKGTDEEADFEVTVQKVQRMVVPELTDDFVAENFGEFDTVDAWRADVGERLQQGKLGRARQQLVGRITEALAGLVDIEPPAPMVENELQNRVQNTVRQFQAQGIDLEAWLSATGQEPDDFVNGMRGAAVEAVKADLALRAVATAEGFDADDDEVEAEYARIAMRVGQKAKDVRRAYERNDAVPELMSQIRTSKAFDWLLHHVELVDPDGAPIDRDLVLGHTHDEHGGHIHDHDHDGHHDHDHELDMDLDEDLHTDLDREPDTDTTDTDTTAAHTTDTDTTGSES
jgi:trigger factor